MGSENKKDSSLIGLMDAFFSNDREFWGDIENALGEYDEEKITDFCEPDNPKDFNDHPGQWQDGVKGGISWVFTICSRCNFEISYVSVLLEQIANAMIDNMLVYFSFYISLFLLILQI